MILSFLPRRAGEYPPRRKVSEELMRTFLAGEYQLIDLYLPRRIVSEELIKNLATYPPPPLVVIRAISTRVQALFRPYTSDTTVTHDCDTRL